MVSVLETNVSYELTTPLYDASVKYVHGRLQKYHDESQGI